MGGPFAIISGLISFKYRIRALQIDFEDLKRWQKLYAVSSMWEKNYPQDKHCKHKKRWLKLLNKCNKYIVLRVVISVSPFGVAHFSAIKPMN